MKSDKFDYLFSSWWSQVLNVRILTCTHILSIYSCMIIYGTHEIYTKGLIKQINRYMLTKWHQEEATDPSSKTFVSFMWEQLEFFGMRINKASMKNSKFHHNTSRILGEKTPKWTNLCVDKLNFWNVQVVVVLLQFSFVLQRHHKQHHRHFKNIAYSINDINIIL